MGVKGLWQLLLPIGRRISIETLEGKVLAIDASIWLLQFIKAMRDPETGSVKPAAHLIGFFRRLCKLRYHGIRPVFVFDGATPEIKLRELALRRKRRDQFTVGSASSGKDGKSHIDTAFQRMAKRILAQQLKKHGAIASNKTGEEIALDQEKQQRRGEGEKADGDGGKASNAQQTSTSSAPGFYDPELDDTDAQEQDETKQKGQSAQSSLAGSQQSTVQRSGGDDNDKGATTVSDGNQRYPNDSEAAVQVLGASPARPLSATKSSTANDEAIAKLLSEQQDYLQPEGPALEKSDWDTAVVLQKQEYENAERPASGHGAAKGRAAGTTNDNRRNGGNDSDSEYELDADQPIDKPVFPSADRRRGRGKQLNKRKRNGGFQMAHASNKNGNSHSFAPDDPDQFDVDFVASLPSSDRKEQVEEAHRRQRMRSRSEFMQVAANPEELSKCQLRNFLRYTKLNKDAVKVAKQVLKNEEEVDESGNRIRTNAADPSRKIFFQKDGEKKTKDRKNRGGKVSKSSRGNNRFVNSTNNATYDDDSFEPSDLEYDDFAVDMEYESRGKVGKTLTRKRNRKIHSGFIVAPPSQSDDESDGENNRHSDGNGNADDDDDDDDDIDWEDVEMEAAGVRKHGGDDHDVNDDLKPAARTTKANGTAGFTRHAIIDIDEEDDSDDGIGAGFFKSTAEPEAGETGGGFVVAANASATIASSAASASKVAPASRLAKRRRIAQDDDDDDENGEEERDGSDIVAVVDGGMDGGASHMASTDNCGATTPRKDHVLSQQSRDEQLARALQDEENGGVRNGNRATIVNDGGRFTSVPKKLNGPKPVNPYAKKPTARSAHDESLARSLQLEEDRQAAMHHHQQQQELEAKQSRSSMIVLHDDSDDENSDGGGGFITEKDLIDPSDDRKPAARPTRTIKTAAASSNLEPNLLLLNASSASEDDDEEGEGGGGGFIKPSDLSNQMSKEASPNITKATIAATASLKKSEQVEVIDVVMHRHDRSNGIPVARKPAANLAEPAKSMKPSESNTTLTESLVVSSEEQKPQQDGINSGDSDDEDDIDWEDGDDFGSDKNDADKTTPPRIIDVDEEPSVPPNKSDALSANSSSVKMPLSSPSRASAEATNRAPYSSRSPEVSVNQVSAIDDSNGNDENGVTMDDHIDADGDIVNEGDANGGRYGLDKLAGDEWGTNDFDAIGSQDDTAAALEQAQATAAKLTDWAGRAFRRAIAKHAADTGITLSTSLSQASASPEKRVSPLKTNSSQNQTPNGHPATPSNDGGASVDEQQFTPPNRSKYVSTPQKSPTINASCRKADNAIAGSPMCSTPPKINGTNDNHGLRDNVENSSRTISLVATQQSNNKMENDSPTGDGGAPSGTAGAFDDAARIDEGRSRGDDDTVTATNTLDASEVAATLEEYQSKWAEERRQADREMDTVTDEMKTEAMQLLQLFGVPYLVAPAEAEAQCVALEQLGLVHGIVTEDSDAFVFGGKTVYKNIFDDQKYVEAYRADDAKREMEISWDGMIALAMLLGSDYTEGVKGVGIVNGMEILQGFDVSQGVKKGLKAFRRWLEAFDPNDAISKHKSRFDGNRREQIFHHSHHTARARWIPPANFPDDKVLNAYQNPVVDRSDEQFTWGVPDTEKLVLFCNRHAGWSSDETIGQLEPVVKRIEGKSVQTRIDSFMRYEDGIRFAQVRSKRLRAVLQTIQQRYKKGADGDKGKDDDTDATDGDSGREKEHVAGDDDDVDVDDE